MWQRERAIQNSNQMHASEILIKAATRANILEIKIFSA